MLNCNYLMASLLLLLLLPHSNIMPAIKWTYLSINILLCYERKNEVEQCDRRIVSVTSSIIKMMDGSLD